MQTSRILNAMIDCRQTATTHNFYTGFPQCTLFLSHQNSFQGHLRFIGSVPVWGLASFCAPSATYGCLKTLNLPSKFWKSLCYGTGCVHEVWDETNEWKRKRDAPIRVGARPTNWRVHKWVVLYATGGWCIKKGEIRSVFERFMKFWAWETNPLSQS